jgi:hypothetical protein
MSPSLEGEFRRAERHLARAVAAEAELARVEAAVARVLALCERWDRLSRGESVTTRAVREAVAGEAGDAEGEAPVELGIQETPTIKKVDR